MYVKTCDSEWLSKVRGVRGGSVEGTLVLRVVSREGAQGPVDSTKDEDTFSKSVCFIPFEGRPLRPCSKVFEERDRQAVAAAAVAGAVRRNSTEACRLPTRHCC